MELLLDETKDKLLSEDLDRYLLLIDQYIESSVQSPLGSIDTSNNDNIEKVKKIGTTIDALQNKLEQNIMKPGSPLEQSEARERKKKQYECSANLNLILAKLRNDFDSEESFANIYHARLCLKWLNTYRTNKQTWEQDQIARFQGRLLWEKYRYIRENNASPFDFIIECLTKSIDQYLKAGDYEKAVIGIKERSKFSENGISLSFWEIQNIPIAGMKLLDI